MPRAAVSAVDRKCTEFKILFESLQRLKVYAQGDGLSRTTLREKVEKSNMFY